MHHKAEITSSNLFLSPSCVDMSKKIIIRVIYISTNVVQPKLPLNSGLAEWLGKLGNHLRPPII
jgi:hypothetical protein